MEGRLTLQPIQSLIPQSVLRQHSPHCPLQHLSSSPLPHHALHIHTLQRPRSRRSLVVQFLLFLLAGDEHVVAASCDHVITAVGGGIPDGFVLALEEDRDLSGDATKRGGGWGGEGDVVPCSTVC